MSKPSFPNARGFDAACLNLADWFERSSRVLPWRSRPEPYAVWVSEIMLQQTQVVTVRPYFERFLERFPSVESLAQASEADVTLAWAGLGYYSRARNLLKAAQQVVAAGGFPTTREGWEGLPGVGPYTAGAVLSIAYNQSEALLDGNVERVWSRLREIRRAPRGESAYKKRLWRLSRFWVERAAALGVRPSVTNQALMELGALICTPRNPRCEVCPVSAICRARAHGTVEAFPERKARAAFKDVQETVVCAVSARGEVLVRLRGAGEWRAGLWDLPGSEELSLSGEVYGEARAKLVVTNHRIVRTVKLVRGAVSAPEGFAWVDPRKPALATGSSFKKSVQSLFERYPEAFQ